MNKSVYAFGILFLGLSVLCSLLQAVLRFQIGMQMFMLDSYIAWFFLMNIIVLIASVFLLKYYQYKKYWFAFSAGGVATIVNLFFAFVFYRILFLREWAGYYMPMLLVSLCAGILYAISLIFSDAGKKFWLKITGIYVFVIGLVLVSMITWSLTGHTTPSNSTLEKITEWASIAGNLAPCLIIMHFIAELKLLKAENTAIPIREPVKNTLSLIAITAIIFTIIFGGIITSECYSQIYWTNQNFKGTKKWAQTFEARIFVNSKGDTLFYRLLKPLNYDPQKKYPLVVSLPYGGEPATDKIKQIEGAVAAELLSTDPNRRKYPAFLFVPNCPPGSGWGGIPNYPSVDSLVYGAIGSLDKEFPIDVKRQYVTGISRGGYGTWNFICTRPDMFAAAIPVSGGGDPKLASKIVNISVWAFHGEKDRNVPVSGSRDMINAIRKAGGKPKYTEYPDKAHNIWDRVSITPGLWDWLFAQKRN